MLKHNALCLMGHQCRFICEPRSTSEWRVSVLCTENVVRLGYRYAVPKNWSKTPTPQLYAVSLAFFGESLLTEALEVDPTD